MVIPILTGLGIVSYLFATVMFAVEAWHESPIQSVLVLSLPGYVFHFALIKSERERPYLALLFCSVVIGLLAPVVMEFVQRLEAA